MRAARSSARRRRHGRRRVPPGRSPGPEQACRAARVASNRLGARCRRLDHRPPAPRAQPATAKRPGKRSARRKVDPHHRRIGAEPGLLACRDKPVRRGAEGKAAGPSRAIVPSSGRGLVTGTPAARNRRKKHIAIGRFCISAAMLAAEFTAGEQSLQHRRDAAAASPETAHASCLDERRRRPRRRLKCLRQASLRCGGAVAALFARMSSASTAFGGRHRGAIFAGRGNRLEPH